MKIISRIYLSFGKDLEGQYKASRVAIDIANTRFGFPVLILIEVLLIVADVYRLDEPQLVVASRIATIVFSLVILWLTYYRKFWSSILIPVFYCVLAVTFFLTVFDDSSPRYFLTNTLVTFFFLVFTFASTRFLFSLLTCLFALTLFIVFVFFFNASDHLAKQMVNVVLNFLFALGIGYLWEKQKRRNFTQQMDIETKNAELTKVNDQKNKIISILSHDLASPLNSLQGLLRVSEGQNLSETEWKEYSGKIGDQLQRTSQMLQDLVRWAKTQLEGYEPTWELVGISDVIGEVIAIQAQVAKEKSISLLKLTMPFSFYTDKEMLRLLIRNIISNAIKFSKQGGRVSVNATDAGSEISITINDNGIGMDKETVEKLFGHSIKSTIGTSNEKGTGLGLKLVKEIVGVLNGQIAVESELGNGSTFTITLPKRNT